MGEVEKITSLESSTSTLVTLVHFVVASFMNRRVPDIEVRIRLYLQSILSDGHFARLLFKTKQESCSVSSKIADCIKAATRSEDMVESPVPAYLRALFADRLVTTLISDFLPAKPAIDYGVSREKLIEHAVWFMLRGMGMKEESIRRYYNPKALELLVA